MRSKRGKERERENIFLGILQYSVRDPSTVTQKEEQNDDLLYPYTKMYEL